jgi:putative ABC transport system ATP-binding protein
MLTVDEVTLGYPGNPAVLNGVSVAVEPGQMLAVTGPSGAGKTTLLWAMAGLLRPQRGAVAVGGSPLRDHEHAVRHVVLIPQDNGLAAILTAAGERPGRPGRRRFAGGEARRAPPSRSNGWACPGRPTSSSRSCPGGQQQRAAIARGLALRGDVVLADEVTSELDATNRQRVLGCCRGGPAGRGRGVRHPRPGGGGGLRRRAAIADGRAELVRGMSRSHGARPGAPVVSPGRF